jgi:hemerythrin superfamily protein
MTANDQRDLVEILVHDHREVEELFIELEKGTGDVKRRRALTSAVIAELVRHSVAEELYLYPTVRRVLPDGDGLADHEIAEHAQAERLMKRLEGLEPTDAQFERELGELISAIRHHVREEEADLFPRLQAVCTERDLRDLGRRVEFVKKLVPTRPHPDAPDTPPWNAILGPGIGLVDRIRDAISRRPTEPDDVL